MDGVSGAASVVGIATITLQSAKLIYEAVTGIKNGPSLVQQLASTLQDLQRVLQRVIDLKRKPEQANPTNLDELETLAQKCATDVRAMQEKLVKLSGGGKIELAWKRVKTYLQAKDLEVMQATIRQHTHMLSAEMAIVTL